MVAPWVVEEDGRSYKLKVTKTKQQEILGKNKTVSDREPHSNKDKSTYELHIVAPPADKDGKVTTKKITSKHKFLHKECDLKMLVKSGKQEKSISEGGSFEIDTNGNIKGAMEQKCEKEAFKSKVNPTDYNTLAGYLKALQEETSPEEMAKEIEIYLKTIEAQEIEASEEKTDMEIVLGALFNPKSIANKIELVPDGSKKCVSNPKPSVYVYPYSKADGTFSFMYAKARKTEIQGYSGQLKVSRAEVEVTGNFNLYYGTKVITIGGSQKVGGGSYIRKRKRDGERGAGKSMFGTMETILNYFKKMQNEQNKHNISQGRGSSVAKNHTLFKFDPGRTGFSVAIKQHELKEINDDYKIDYISDISLNIHVLNGVSITVDCIEYLIMIARVSAPYVATLLSSARDKLDAGMGGKNLNVKAGAEIELSLNGGITSTLKWKKELNKGVEIKEDKLAGTIGFKAKANIYGESKILFVTIKGQAGGMAASAIRASIPSQLTLKASLKNEDNELKLGGGVDFTGLALYYVLSGGFNIKDDAESKGSGGGIFDSDSIGLESTISKETKFDGYLTLFEAWDDKNGEKDAYYDLEQFFD